MEPDNMAEVIEATTVEHYRHGRLLIEEYARFVGLDLTSPTLAWELANLSDVYGPPKGALLLARDAGAFVGCIGLRPMGGEVAEMKRFFVQPLARGKGCGKLLLDAFIAKARALGYKAVRLTTVPALASALALYHRFGFAQIAPYRDDAPLDAIFMELRL